jgi:acetyltransferase
MLGPDCMGVVSDAGTSPWIGTLPAAERAHKSVAIVSQSGAVAEAIIAAGDRLGLSLVVSVGSEATFDVADACDHLGATEGTRAVGLFLETVRRPRELQRALELLAERDVPVVCLKTGASRAAAAGAHAHSGADAGDVDAFAAFARSSGIIVAPHFAAFMETLVLLQATRRPRGARVAAVTNSGGEAQLLADEGEAAGLRFDPVSPDTARALGAVRPRPLPALNPLDAWCGDAVDETFRATLDILAGSGDYDVLVGLVDQSPHITGLEIGNGLALAGALVAAAEAHGLPAAIVSSLASEPVPAIAELAAAHDAALLRTISSALAAIAAVGRWASHRAAPSVDAVRVGARLADLRVDHRLDPHYGPYVKVSTPAGDDALALTPLSVAVAATLLLDLGASGDPGAFAAGIGAPEALARPTAAG